MSGYGNSEANDQALTRGWFRTGDQGYLDKDGYLFISGRLKEIINRGGEKISPREIEDVILQHPAVAEAITFAMPHETLGEDIAAAVVLLENAAVTEGELQRFCRRSAGGIQDPATVLFVDEIPKSSTGKPQRVGLAEKLGCASFTAANSRVPSSPDSSRKNFGGHLVGQFWSRAHWHPGQLFQFGWRLDPGNASDLSNTRLDANGVVDSRVFLRRPRWRISRSTLRRPVGQSRCKADPCSRSARNEKLPLSFAQQRLWLLNQLEPANPVYNRPLAFRLAGKLQPEVIERCLNEIVRRHEVLRTNFQDNGDEAVQIISPNLTVDLPLIDLSHLPDSEREAEALPPSQQRIPTSFRFDSGSFVADPSVSIGRAGPSVVICHSSHRF